MLTLGHSDLRAPLRTAAAQPSAKMACKIASLMLSSKVVCTEDSSTQIINAYFPGFAWGKQEEGAEIAWKYELES